MDIYLDNAASTPVDSRVQRAMNRAVGVFGNPSSFNEAGRTAAGVLEDARARVAAFLHARAGEVVFCASGSEANALALIGTAHTSQRLTGILTTKIEHLSVLEPVRALEGQGANVTYIPIDGEGVVDVRDVIRRLRPSVRIVSLMYANNEIGTVQPIERIGRAIAQYRRTHRSNYPLLHVDACQASAYLNMNVQQLGVDLLALNGAKAYGPHGSAVLYVRRGITVRPLVSGGSQEGGRRAGTEDVVSAVGLATALGTIRPADTRRVAMLRDRLIAGIMRTVPDARLNGPVGERRLAGNVNISIPDTDSESLLLELDRRGIRAGSGSACTAHSVEPSHVLVAIGTPVRYLDGVLRFSLSRMTKKSDIDAVIDALPGIIGRVRARHTRTKVS